MKFSFITCTYNRAQYLGRTLESICEQTYPISNYEIVVVDNNSSDNTQQVYNQYAAKYTDRQINYFKEINQGFSFALNRAIKESKGDFIIFVDDDETVNKNHLELLDKYLTTYPDTVLAGSPVVPIYENGRPKWLSRFIERAIGGYFNQGTQVKKLNKSNFPGTGHTIIKRAIYQKVGFYNTELGRSGTSLLGAEDKDMFHRLVENNIECYYFPAVPIFHHIPAYKLTDSFFNKLTYSIGKSEHIRTLSVSKNTYRKRLFDELVKWAASCLLCIIYTIRLAPEKGYKILQFRWNVSKGLLGK